MLPYNLAFDINSMAWCIIYYTIDFLFLVDIFIMFSTTLPETDDYDEVTDRWIISKSYLKGWFFIDLLAILPFDYFSHLWKGGRILELCAEQEVEERSQTKSDINNLLRVGKLEKVMKAIRILRMVKLMKLVKNSDELHKKI